MSKGIGGHQRAYRGQSDVWLTPPWILEELGPFDLDPCPCVPQPYPTAKRVIDGDGLAAEWRPGESVWLNPPYGPELGVWLKRLAAHGNGVAICFARTETRAFFDHVWKKASGLLFVEGRLHFRHADGRRAKGNAGAPSVLIAYGMAMAERLAYAKIPGAFVANPFVHVRRGGQADRRPSLFSEDSP
jgi:hypothetical protein